MSDDSPGKVTVKMLTGYLQRLGFESPHPVSDGLVLSHPATEVMIVLTARDSADPVRPADMLSVWMRLDHWGLASEADLRCLRSGRLPKAA